MMPQPTAIWQGGQVKRRPEEEVLMVHKILHGGGFQRYSSVTRRNGHHRREVTLGVSWHHASGQQREGVRGNAVIIWQQRAVEGVGIASQSVAASSSFSLHTVML